MKKPLLPALPLCFGLLPLALFLSFSPPQPSLPRPITPLTQSDTTPPATLQISSSRVTLQLYPALLQGHYTAINLEWQSTVNGLPGQKGVLLHRNLSATGPTSIILPLRLPPTNDEIILHVTGRLAPTPGKKQNAPLFTTHLPLRPWRGDYSLAAAGDLSFTDSNNIFTIISAKTQVQFDKQTGWLLQYKAGGSVLMGDTAGLRSDLGLPDTLQPHLQLFFASTGTQIVIVKAEYTLPEINCLLHLSYTFNAAGDMLVEQVLEADTTAPSPTSPTLTRSELTLIRSELTLTRFGMTWLLPQNLDSVSWYGASEQAIATITPPVSLSREAAFRGIRWLTLGDREGKGPRIVADSNLLQLTVLPANSLPAQLHPQQLGIYSTMYPATQRRFNFSFKVMPQPAAGPPPTNHPDQKK
jgi:hypothetical protein